MKFGIKQIHKPTPAKMAKLGIALTAVSAIVASYGLTLGNKWIGYFGLGCAVVGTLCTNLFGANETH